MLGVHGVQVKDTAAFRRAVGSDEEFVLFEGLEPVARVVPIGAEVKAQEARFTHYPHDGAQCLYTCWRHPRELQDQDAAPAAPAITASE